MTKLKLLPESDLIKTGPVDHADWNYKSIIKFIQKKRFEICINLLNRKKYNRLLEIGYGSGIFIPSLAELASEVYGIDIHNKNEEVKEVLHNHNIDAKLFSSSAEEIPFEDKFFDVIVTVSAVEFIDNLTKACKEIKRVLKDDGIFIVITPGYSPIVDLGLKILTGEDAEKDYKDRRNKIIPTLSEHFIIKEKIFFPKFTTRVVRLYNGLKLVKK